MPILDLSTEFLQRFPERLGMIELEGVVWSDWEAPDRIRDTLKVLGKEPAFPSERLMPTCSSAHEPSLLEVTRGVVNAY